MQSIQADESSAVRYDYTGVSQADESNKQPDAGLIFFFNDPATTEIYTTYDTLSLHDALPIFIGIPAISVYNVGNAVKELERCRKAGLRGALIWQAPHPDLPFHSSHYDKFWAAAEDLDAPVSMHILTGHSYHSKERKDT